MSFWRCTLTPTQAQLLHEAMRRDHTTASRRGYSSRVEFDLMAERVAKEHEFSVCRPGVFCVYLSSETSGELSYEVV